MFANVNTAQLLVRLSQKWLFVLCPAAADKIRPEWCVTTNCLLTSERVGRWPRQRLLLSDPRLNHTARSTHRSENSLFLKKEKEREREGRRGEKKRNNRAQLTPEEVLTWSHRAEQAVGCHSQ